MRQPIDIARIVDVVEVALRRPVAPLHRRAGIDDVANQLHLPRTRARIVHHRERNAHRDFEAARDDPADRNPARFERIVLGRKLVVRADRRRGELVAKAARPVRPQVDLEFVVGVEAHVVRMLRRADRRALLRSHADVKVRRVGDQIRRRLLRRRLVRAQIVVEPRHGRILPNGIGQRPVDRGRRRGARDLERTAIVRRKIARRSRRHG